MNDRLDPRLSALLRRERDCPDPSELTKQRVWARVGATLVAPAPSTHPAPSSPPAAALSSIGRIAAASVALAAGASVALVAGHTMSARPASPRAAPASAPASAPAPVVVALPAATAPAPESAPSGARTPPMAATASAPGLGSLSHPSWGPGSLIACSHTSSNGLRRILVLDAADLGFVPVEVVQDSADQQDPTWAPSSFTLP